MRILSPEGEVPREGVLLVGRSPAASFPALAGKLPFPLQVRRVPFRFGRARILLPRGLPVALAWKDHPGWAWRGPFFGGQTILLQTEKDAALTLRIHVPKGLRARLTLTTAPPPGTGAVRTFQVEGILPGPLRLASLPAGPARVFLLVQGRAAWKGKVRLRPGEERTLSPALGRGAVLEGRILDLPGRERERTRFYLDGRLLPWARASSSGVFRLTEIPPDGEAHRLDLVFPGRPPALLWWAPSRPGQVRKVEIRPDPPFVLEGRLLLPGGEPAGNHPLAALGRKITPLGWTSWIVTGRTGKEGAWALPVPPGPQRAVLFVPSREGGPWGLLLTPPLTGKEKLDLGDLVLPLGTRLSGTLKGPDARALRRAEVELLPPRGSPVPEELLSRTTPPAPDGSFLFLGVGKGVHILRARAPGRAGIERRIRVGAAPVHLDLALPEGLVVEGRVRLQGGGAAPGARILLEPLALGWIPVVVLADSKGRFLARGVPPVPCRVTARWTRGGAVWSARTLYPGKGGGELDLRLFREP